ncbi:MAG: IS30 family transposase [Clostridia bacterium]
MSHYRHPTTEERESAMIMRSNGLSFRAIALILGRHASTLTREFRRNIKPDGCYRASYATKQYNKRRKKSCKKSILSNPIAMQFVIGKMLIKWTPEQISGYSKLHAFPISFSYGTIYRAIDNHILPSPLKKEMRFKNKYKTHKKNDKRGKMQDITSIHKRSASIENRKSLGHWESDTILGKRKTGAIATHVERKSGYLIAAKIEKHNSELFTEVTIKSFAKIPKKYCRTFTVDRGKEFTLHKILAEKLKARIYFCDPYAPWQRGTNENTNGLLRQFYPKKTSFAHITQDDLELVVALINQRPRKRLGWRTPEEVFYKNYFR